MCLGLNILETVIQQRWRVLSEEHRNGIRQYVVMLINRLAYDHCFIMLTSFLLDLFSKRVRMQKVAPHRHHLKRNVSQFKRRCLCQNGNVEVDDGASGVLAAFEWRARFQKCCRSLFSIHLPSLRMHKMISKFLLFC